MSYWQGCFPNRYEFTLSFDDALMSRDAPSVRGKRDDAQKRFLSFQRVGTRGASRKALVRQIKQFVSRDGETIQARHFNFVGFIFDSPATSGAPIGFATFDIRLEHTPGGRIKRVTFEPDLIYVAKAKRGRRLGRLLAASFEIWLLACKVHGPRVTKGGIEVNFCSEYETFGGKALGDLIAGHFELLHDMIASGDSYPRDCGWHIRNFENDADPMTNEVEELIRIRQQLG
jgi:GNAT superfamily N-acetyltransferase